MADSTKTNTPRGQRGKARRGARGQHSADNHSSHRNQTAEPSRNNHQDEASNQEAPHAPPARRNNVGRGGKGKRGGRGSQHQRGNLNAEVGRTRLGIRSYNVFAHRTGSEFSTLEIREFLEHGMLLVEDSIDSRENFITDLASENGLFRVRHIVEADFSVSYSISKLMFDPHCILFLRIITHEEVRYSLRLENSIGTIYNFIYGIDGNRGVKFIQNVATCLVKIKDDADNEDGKLGFVVDVLLLATKTLLSILTLNQVASIMPEFKDVVKQLCSCYNIEDVNRRHQGSKLHYVHDDILKIRAILAIGDDIPTLNTDKSKTQAKNSFKPPITVDLPGERSQYGPRHDNDHELISEIKILPTISEILCNSQREDYLPTRDAYSAASGHHETGILRLLDSQFRLLREDTSGLLRDAMRVIIENWEVIAHGSDWRSKYKIIRENSPTPLRIYSGAEIQRIKSLSRKGMEIDLEFDQPPRARHQNMAKRKKFWQVSRALREGKALLALINAEEEDPNIVFLQVSKRDIGSWDRNEQQQSSDTHHISDLISDAQRAMITLRLASSTDEESIYQLVELTRRRQDRPEPARHAILLIEFPAILYNTFEGILRCLQNLHKDPSRIPFATWLAPRTHDHSGNDPVTTNTDGDIIVPLPPYLQKDVTIDISCIPRNENAGDNTALNFSSSQDAHELSERISRETTLDNGQAIAMASALTHEIALIQGPPGTGKSYVGIQIARCLLKNRDILQLGPILCVCYTNHALDQFLSELLKSGIDSIVRLATYSSQPGLEALSLENLKKNKTKSHVPGLGRKIASCQADLDMLKSQIEEICTKILNVGAEEIHEFLQRRYPQQATDLFKITTVQSIADTIEMWLSYEALTQGDEERSIEQLSNTNCWMLKRSERLRLYKYWHDCIFLDLSQALSYLVTAHARKKQILTSLFEESDKQLLSRFQVVGVTTQGLANNSDLIRGLGSRVLICEEAGEVLESHILTALLPSIQHAILIGDHLQLRPKISNLKLSMEYDHKGPKYNLDESLFERLANSRFGNPNTDGSFQNMSRSPITQLDHQRRMHPSVSNLIRETLYPNLLDHPKTKEYPEIPGMRRRLFWLDHRNPEDKGDPDEPMQSKTNTWEAQMVMALVKHLCRQGKYDPGEIAVLTPYVGQMKLLMEMLGEVADLIISDRDLEDLDETELDGDGTNRDTKSQHRQKGIQKGKILDKLRISSVDNFQGEEATVVIVSLVRSNKFRNCGFLKTPNRINVLLSRAKHGMYIIGDAQTSSSAPMWASVVRLFEQNANLGPQLELHCPRHPSKKVYVSSPEDFVTKAPEGGCSEKCGLRLICGHSCAVKCHSKSLHRAVKCIELCTKTRPCGHLCSKKCGAPCGDCTEKVTNVVLPCGHTAKELECHHTKKLADIKCNEMIEREITDCGHKIEVRCHESQKSIRCSQKCNTPLLCGHNCSKSCSLCRRRENNTSIVDHGICNTSCGRQYSTCPHTCNKPCHSESPCPPCNRPCEIRCAHSRCPKKCSEPCPPCAENCGWHCSHREDKCTMPCAVPCNIVPCNNRCERKLKGCGHQCPGVCGEECPDSKFCPECCEPSILAHKVDLFMFEEYREIDIDKDPLIFPRCGHFFTVSSLDGVMKLKQHYDIDPATNKIIRPKALSRIPHSEMATKSCPECRMPLRDINRYNRIVKIMMLDEATRKFVSHSNQQYTKLIDDVIKREKRIEEERKSFMLEWSPEAGGSKVQDQINKSVEAYQEQRNNLQKRINKFTKSVSKTEQPFVRVNDLFTVTAARQNKSTLNTFEFDESNIQAGFHLKGQCLHLRLTWTILWDLDTIYNNRSLDPRMLATIRDEITTKLKGMLNKCDSLASASQKANHPQQEVEARIYHALFSVLSLNNSKDQGESLGVAEESAIRDKEMENLEECEKLYEKHKGTMAHLKEEIEKAKRVVRGATFYSAVTTDEKREVYKALATQFSGTGHWYYCRNNHPFTVGECGMPMEQARCPECGEPVGGHDHVSVEGVRRAEEFDSNFYGH
ncbi:hypothetical protein F5884DRAFT_799194 [Xylogone sp. PMI_703]|nr:hypothetical protein F5884DRAFT_799194 [Xylogone sp. PMI_703]